MNVPLVENIQGIKINQDFIITYVINGYNFNHIQLFHQIYDILVKFARATDKVWESIIQETCKCIFFLALSVTMVNLFPQPFCAVVLWILILNDTSIREKMHVMKWECSTSWVSNHTICKGFTWPTGTCLHNVDHIVKSFRLQRPEKLSRTAWPEGK